MYDNEKITVIIATHNNAKTIKRAIHSVTTGIRAADQVIIGDNDSKDGTYELLCELLDAKNVTIEGQTGLPPKYDGEINNTKIKIFRKKLSTIGHTINTAIQMKWEDVTIFGFLDPTSWYAGDKISQAVSILNSQPSIACVVSDCDNYHVDGMVERVFRSSFDMQKLLASNMYDRNFLVRPQIFPKLKSGFNEQMVMKDDYEFLLRTSEIGLIYHIPAPLHNNTIIEIDEVTRTTIQQCEDFARQMAIQRRNPNGG